MATLENIEAINKQLLMYKTSCFYGTAKTLHHKKTQEYLSLNYNSLADAIKEEVDNIKRTHETNECKNSCKHAYSCSKKLKFRRIIIDENLFPVKKERNSTDTENIYHVDLSHIINTIPGLVLERTSIQHSGWYTKQQGTLKLNDVPIEYEQHMVFQNQYKAFNREYHFVPLIVDSTKSNNTLTYTCESIRDLTFSFEFGVFVDEELGCKLLLP